VLEDIQYERFCELFFAALADSSKAGGL